MKYAALSLALALVATPTFAAESGDGMRQFLAGREARDAQVARTIWEYAEVGYQETKSSALLQEELTKAGFKVEARVAEIPTAFVASAGSGKPATGIRAEFDPLPGINQAAGDYTGTYNVTVAYN
jgi:aminobenzoyl-glutamate utilization protein B